jgi:trimeric autotransporter adhesin
MNPLYRTLITAFLFIGTPAFLYAQAPSNDNCSGAITLTSGNTCNSATYNIRNATNSSPTGACGGATSTTTYDVWFRFQAVATTTTITLSNFGSKLSGSSLNPFPYVEVLSGTCGSFTSIGCQIASSRLTLSGLTVGTFYYIRVYVLVSPTASGNGKWDFNICVQHTPANDDCSGAINLTPGATCSNTSGTLDLSTSNTSGVVASCWAANTYNDVWYKFTATSTGTYAITLSNLGANISNPRLQIYSGSCGSLSILGCATTSSLTQAVTSGTTYYIRVANTTDPSGTGGVAGFSICVTTNTTAAPANDLCSGAISLTSSTSCSAISGTLLNATATAGLTACGSIDQTSAEVWYSFVAQSAYPSITLTESFPGGGMKGWLQIFSGSCGTLTSLGCNASPTLNTATVVGGSGLTAGNTYYIRVTTNKSTGIPTSGAWGFSICVTDPASSVTVDYGKSYVNITKGSNGGTINPGDTLEIRATLVVGGSGSIDSVAYYDTLRNTRGFALVPASISLRTNEGKVYKSYTDNYDGDAGWRSTSGSDTAIQINMGTGASNVARGKIFNTSRPSNFGSTCIVMATYRVVVYAAYNTKINFGGGKFSYRDNTSGVLTSISFPSDSLIVYSSPGLCPNAVSPTNIVSDEYSGTFGTPSVATTGTRNRGTSPNTNYVYQVFGPPTGGGGPNDYYYGIANNTSGVNPPIITTTLPKPSTGNNRVFNVWDITGDHTGATNTAKGNLPCDVTKPVSATNPCGYMLVVNSAYNTDTAFQYNVSNICTNTYYEISAWFKNVCYKCGCDSMGNGSSSGSYIPTGAADSSGVKPNIAIALDGIDYYTTGNLQYQGLAPATQTGSDTVNKWVKRGFTYKTGPTQTSFVLTFRNNAPGGGGNDWAIDDIAMATCLPNMSYSPTAAPIVCDSNYIDINDTIRSYFNTYADYIWQRSTDNGATWADIGSTQGTGTPVWNGSAYQYVASYRIPNTATYLSDSGDLYRVVVGTTASNVTTPGCQNTDGVSIITLNVINCYTPLYIDMLSFNGKLVTDHANLFWNTSKEDEPVHFDIEKSSDGINFTKIGTLNSYANYTSEVNYYSFSDPAVFSGKTWYRIVMLSNKGAKKYSRTIQLSNEQIDFGLRNIINPFGNQLAFEVITTNNAKIDVSIIDLFGKTIKHKNYTVYSGVNSLSIENTQALNPGIYILQVKSNNITINNKVLKK